MYEFVRSACVLAVITALALLLSSCDDGDGIDYTSIQVSVKNDTTETITLHYSTLSWSIVGSCLVDTTDTIPPLGERSFTHYYVGIPDVRVTGPGYDRAFNAISYQGGAIVVHQDDLVISGG